MLSATDVIGQERTPTPPLTGIRVVSLAEQYPGPFATMVLADLGADVILVERPGVGDPSRRFIGHFAALNRGKRSIELDLKDAGDAEDLWNLIATADVFVEGYRPGVMDRLGFGAAAVQARQPSLIYCSISSFGQTGPLSSQGAHDLSVQGLAGLVKPQFDGAPKPASLPVGDLASALFAVIGIITSLYERRETDRGRCVDIAMLDSVVSLMTTTLGSVINGQAPAPYPPEDPGYGVFQTSDCNLITLSIAGEDHHWRALCEVLDLPDITSLTTSERESRRLDLVDRLRTAIGQESRTDLLRRLEKSGVPSGEVNAPAEVAEHCQVEARGIVVRGAASAHVAQPILIDGVRFTTHADVPGLGQHSAEIRSELS